MKTFAADAIVDKMGVNQHLHYDDTNSEGSFNAYGDFDKKVLPALGQLGVRHLRDGLPAYQGVSRDGFFYQRLRRQVELGYRLTMLVTGAFDGRPQTDMAMLKTYQEWAGGGIEAFEGLNEPDGDPAAARRIQKELWDAVKAQGLNVPVLSPSMIWNNKGLGDVGAWVTHGNMHTYYGKGMPGGPLQSDIKSKSACWPGKPIMITECGPHNAVNSKEGHDPIDEEGARRYGVRMVLEYASEVERMFFYELLDQHANPGRDRKEDNFGLFRYDGSPKPLTNEIRWLIDLLKEPGQAGYKPQDYDAVVEGDRIRTLFARKRSGEKFLFVWRDVAHGDPLAEVRVTLPEVITKAVLHRRDVVSSKSLELPKTPEGRTVYDVSYTFDPLSGSQSGFVSKPRQLSPAPASKTAFSLQVGGAVCAVQF